MDEDRQRSVCSVVVVGAGVIGLTTAVRLLERGFDVTIVADRRQPETTSNVAAGLWYPYKAGGSRVARWALESLEAYRSLAEESDTGVHIVACRSYVPADEPRPFWADAGVGFQDRSVPDGMDGAPRRVFSSELPIARSGPVMAWLEGRVESLGGRFNLLPKSLLEFESLDASLIVNCTGLGARALCGDEAVVPIRGAVVRMAGTGIDECVTDDVDPDRPTYIIPGDGFCVLGGSAEAGRWDVSVSEDEIHDIVDRCTRLDPRVRKGTIVDVRAGLRPGRSEVRLEPQELAGGRTLVHNYGHGGSGFTLAWGCASEAARVIVGVVR